MRCRLIFISWCCSGMGWADHPPPCLVWLKPLGLLQLEYLECTKLGDHSSQEHIGPNYPYTSFGQKTTFAKNISFAFCFHT